jgi:putative endonuclease
MVGDMARTPTPNPGTVYLLHLGDSLGDPTNRRGQAQHYMGWAKDLDRRLWHHRNGSGARLTAAAAALGIDMHLVRTWEGDRNLERQLKNRKNHRLLCPTCTPPKNTTPPRSIP